MKHIYGTFSAEQIHQQKENLHNSIHWLLLYKEQQYPHLSSYIKSLMIRISGLNKLLNEPAELVTLLSLLQAITDMNDSPNCDFKMYRKLVLDAHSITDMIKEE